MKYVAKRPEDILPDNVNFIERDGFNIRKGSVAAAIANVDIIEAKEATAEEKAAAWAAFKELIPSLNAAKLSKHLAWKNPEIQVLFNNA